MFRTVLGDIVVTVENVRLHAHGMRELNKTLDDLIKKKGTTRFHCQVFANNIFRFAHSHFNTALSIVTTKVPVELTLTAVKPMKGFMRTHILKLWNPDTKEFVPNHVIMSVSSQITVATGESIFYGDILAAVNGKDTGVMSVAEVQRQLRSRIPIHVSIVQISVLRRKDLHEAGIGHEKYQELNLERMSVNI